MADDKTVTKYYPNLALGQMSSAPPRSLDPENGSPYIWRNSLNFIARDNLLQRRGGIAAWTYQPTAVSPGFPLMKGECPLIILTESNSSSSDFMACITTRQILIYPNTATGWRNATPLYSDGNISINNGSAALSGSGTLWSTRFITAGQHVILGGVPYSISSVNSDTSITLSSNYSGTNIVAGGYAIVRNWLEEMNFNFGSAGRGIRPVPDCEVVAVLFNENLYVAGTNIGGADHTARPAVIKVSSVFSNSPTTTYITARDALVAGLDVIAGLSRITGIDCLQDGRVVFAGNTNSVFYSSHLADTVWTTSPAGQVQITLVNGKINALGRIGNNLTLHEDNGIVWGYPTGLADPPLSYQKSAASKGCAYLRTLKQMGGVECFLTSDMDAVSFDGGSVSSLGNGECRKKNLARARRNLITDGTAIDYHAAVDPWRREYFLFGGAGPPSAGGHTDDSLFDIYQFDSETWWPQQIGMPITAASDSNETFQSITTSRMFFGAVTNKDGVVQASMVFQVDDSLVTDPAAWTHASHGSFYVETDDLDFAQPLLDKTAQTVIIWLRRKAGSGTSENFTVSASVDGGNTFTDVTKTFTYGTYSSDDIPIQACFDPLAPGANSKVRFRISWSGSGTANVQAVPVRMHITCQLGGDIRAELL